MTGSSFSPNLLYHRKLVGFAFTHSIRGLDPVMDQRISIEPLGLYTYAGLAALKHSHPLLHRINGWWMRGMKHIPEPTHILILYAKMTWYVSFFVTCGGTALPGFPD